MPDERDDLRLQLSEERRETDAVDAKRDGRMDVLEARFETLQGNVRVLVGALVSLCITVVGAAAAIILTAGGH